jgi:hypothetical protein
MQATIAIADRKSDAGKEVTGEFSTFDQLANIVDEFDKSLGFAKPTIEIVPIDFEPTDEQKQKIAAIEDGTFEEKFGMKIPALDTVTTQEQGHDLAVTWQHWMSEQSLSYGEIGDWQDFFEKVAGKFPALKDEFQANAIIGQDAEAE